MTDHTTLEVRTLATGVGFSEGPVIARDGTISFTSIDQGTVFRVEGDAARPLAVLGGGANGATIGEDGTLYVTQNGGRFMRFGPKWGPESLGGIQAVGPDGTVRWVNRDPVAPNDLCFGPDGLLYVTDPTRSPTIEDGRIWRVDPVSGECELLLSVNWFPNGIGFDKDDALYVASSHDGRIVRFAVSGSNLVDPETVIQMREGRPDGFAFDQEGNLLLPTDAAEDGPDTGAVQVWDAGGKLLEIFRPGGHGGQFTNVALGDDHRLILTASGAGEVLSIDNWPGTGLPLHPFRD